MAEMVKHTLREMKFALLKILANLKKAEYKFNIIPYYLEHHFKMPLSMEDVDLAVKAFEQLKESSLILPTYTDRIHPEDWVKITPAGLQSLERHALDDLDIALQKISPHLVEMRDGAHAALASGQPGSLRQAAASARELVMQALKEGAKNKDVKAQPWFVPDPNPKIQGGITRRHRAKFLILKHEGHILDSEESEKKTDLVISMVDELSALYHSRRDLQYSEVADAINLAEIALRKLFI